MYGHKRKLSEFEIQYLDEASKIAAKNTIDGFVQQIQRKVDCATLMGLVCLSV